MPTQQLNIFPVILSLINVCNTTNVLTGLRSLDVSWTWSLKFLAHMGMLILSLKNEVLFLSPQTK